MVRKIRMSKKEYDKLNRPFTYTPQEFSNYSVTCPNGHKNIIDVVKKHPCLKPIRIGNLLLPTTHFSYKCNQCGIEFAIEIDNIKKTKKLYYFGDEAFRGGTVKDENLIVIYSLIGVNSERIIHAEESFLAFKQERIKEQHPLQWKIHMKEIISPEKRSNLAGFKDKDFSFVVEFINDLFELINKLIKEDTLFIVNSISVVKELDKSILKKVLEKTKHDTYLSLIFSTIDISTKNGVLPEFILDAEKPVKEREVMQGWATEIFNSGENTLLYPLISRGMLIEEPKFVSPGSRPLLEIADVICFTVARFIDLELKGKKEELFDPNKIGKMLNIINFQDGPIFMKNAETFPIEFFK